MASAQTRGNDYTPIPPPHFSQLPLDPNGPPGNAWGRFGPDDTLGMLNLLTPATVAEAAKEIQTGIRVSLDWPLDKPSYPSYKRQGFEHKIINKKFEDRDELRYVNDDILHFNTQGSTQWDGFRHYGNAKHKTYYNNHTQEDITESTALGIDAWADRGGIVGRGILIDYARWAAEQKITLNHFTKHIIPLSDLLLVIAVCDITFRPGDILFVRTGFNAAFDNLSPEEQEALPKRETPDFIGVESSEQMLRFLWDNQFAAVASDCPSFERSPVKGFGDDRWVLHEWLLTGWGMPIGEMFDLEELSEVCNQTGRYEFFLSSVPLKVPGGVASPPNAVAIF
ncbi:hypothetical protein B0O99DRAFT_577969 [Bisporella sp. PMI_857]|nr:hypothetical protein B0O99DRAFT_577969 [Bisporella sp. PMI_857]